MAPHELTKSKPSLVAHMASVFTRYSTCFEHLDAVAVDQVDTYGLSLPTH